MSEVTRTLFPGCLLRGLLVVVLALPAGCHVLTPGNSHQQPPQSIIPAGGFELAYEDNEAPHGRSLHVYLGGDGQVIDGDGRPTKNPTPRYSLALELARIDPARAVYLGRPCQYRLETPLCENTLWTSERYGDEVVDALCQGVAKLAGPTTPLTLIGFSGGGALAVLVSHCATNVVAMVTINGNLDIDYWAQLRGFEPLHGSNNPIDAGPGPSVVEQRHLSGGRDQIVPPAVVAQYAGEHGGALIEYPRFGHRKGWAENWSAVTVWLGGSLSYW